MTDIWPLFDLAVHTPRVTLRYVDDELSHRLADLAALGIHDPEDMPFSVPWTDVEPPFFQRGTLQYHWRCRADTTADSFHLPLAVLADGEVIGASSLEAQSFAVMRQFGTGSWLGKSFQGMGLGRELREATLHLGFAGFDAVRAASGAFADNVRSNAVSHRLGYRENGRRWLLRRGRPAEIIDYALDRAEWEGLRRDDITLHGVDAALDQLGIPRP